MKRKFLLCLLGALGISCSVGIDGRFHPSIASPTSEEIQSWSWSFSGIANSSLSSDYQPVINLSDSSASGSSIQIYDDASCTSEQGDSGRIYSGSAEIDSISYQSDGSDDGVISFYVIVTIPSGLESECTEIELTYTLDTQPPTLATIQGWNWSMSSPSNGSGSSDNTPVISLSGATEDDGVVQVYDDSSCTSSKGSAQTIASGATTHGDISYTLSQEGTKSFYVTVADSVGNVSSCVDISLGYIYDLGPPSTAVVQSWTWTLTGPTNGGLSNDNTPTITLSGSAENGGSVQIYDDSGCTSAKGAAQTISGGATSHTDISYAFGGVHDGVKAFYAIVTDAATNASGCVNLSLGYRLDTVAPNAPTSTSFPDWVTSVNSFGSLTWSDGGGGTDHFEVALGNVSGGTNVMNWTTAASPYTFSGLTLTECLTYYISIRAVDAAGNTSAAATSESFRADATAPSAPSPVTESSTNTFVTRASTVSWGASTDNCQLDHYKYGIGTTSGGTQTIGYTNIGTVTSFQARNGQNSLSFNLVPDTAYYSSVKAVDLAGNESSVSTSPAWRFTCTDPLGSHTLLARYDSSDPSTIIDENGKDANNGSFSGVVERWRDLSGNGNHVDAASSSGRPRYSADSGAMPASQKDSFVQADGVDDALMLDIADVTADFTFFIVFAAMEATPTDYDAFFSNANDPSLTGSWQFHIRVDDSICPGSSTDPNFGARIKDTSADTRICGTSSYDTNPHAAVIRYNSGTGVMTYSLDGVQEGSYTWTNTATFRELRLFRNRAGNTFINARINELALITSSVSSAQDTQIGEYLSCKWDVTY